MGVADCTLGMPMPPMVLVGGLNGAKLDVLAALYTAEGLCALVANGVVNPLEPRGCVVTLGAKYALLFAAGLNRETSMRKLTSKGYNTNLLVTEGVRATAD